MKKILSLCHLTQDNPIDYLLNGLVSKSPRENFQMKQLIITKKFWIVVMKIIFKRASHSNTSPPHFGLQLKEVGKKKKTQIYMLNMLNL